jgi:lysine 2,3-aminomutase
LELMPESRAAIQRLRSAGWMVTNQLVFTASASRRGHTAKLRRVLSEVGVVPYYTFAVKGLAENHHNHTLIARVVQEQVEEKTFGVVPPEHHETLRGFQDEPEVLVEASTMLRRWADLPFLAADQLSSCACRCAPCRGMSSR